MIKNASKVILILLGYIIAGFFIFQVIRANNQKKDIQYKYDMCEVEKGELETRHEEELMVKEAEKTALQDEINKLKKEVSALKKN